MSLFNNIQDGLNNFSNKIYIPVSQKIISPHIEEKSGNYIRMTFLCAPFFTLLGKKFNLMSSVVTGSLKSAIIAKRYYAEFDPSNKDIVVETVKSVATFLAVGTFYTLYPKVLTFLTTTADLIQNISHTVSHLKKGEYQKASEEAAHGIINGIYLGVMLSFSLELEVLYLVLSASMTVYKGTKYRNDKKPEAVAYTLAGLINLHHAYEHFHR